MTTAFCILIMGVSGAGKTTVGSSLADRLGSVFIDGDDLHPAANIEKMKNGAPLNDADRWPWLDHIVQAVQKEMKYRSVVVACSALKKSYRSRLSAIPYHLVYLEGQHEVIKARLQSRTGHFMSIALLNSQFKNLEVPQDALVVPVTWTVEMIVERIIKEFSVS